MHRPTYTPRSKVGADSTVRQPQLIPGFLCGCFPNPCSVFRAQERAATEPLTLPVSETVACSACAPPCWLCCCILLSSLLPLETGSLPLSAAPGSASYLPSPAQPEPQRSPGLGIYTALIAALLVQFSASPHMSWPQSDFLFIAWNP